MIEIIALIFLTRSMGARAVEKGYKALPWKVATVLSWIGFEILGLMFGQMVFPQQDEIPVLWVISGLVFAFGGYLFTRWRLENMPDLGQPGDKLNDIGK
jgi:hypothetical protein